MGTLFRGFLLVIAVTTLYLLFWPTKISPVAWQPAIAPDMTGVYAANNRLAGTEKLALGLAIGPEDIAVDSNGAIYGSLLNGDIIKLDPGKSKPKTITNTGGRPLGLAWALSGELLIADADKGLLSLPLSGPESGTLKVLSTESEGLAFKFTDDVDVAPNGMVYFSDASSKYGYHDVLADALEHQPHGRLLQYDPKTGQTKTLLSNLYFANGVAVGPNADYVLVNETSAYRVTRYWLTGPKAGQSDLFIDNLPGFPDGISYDRNGRFWLAIYAPRSPELDKFADSPRIRNIIYRLPAFMHPKPVMHAMVLALNKNGSVVENLQDSSTDAYAPITSVEAVGNHLYLGSLSFPAIGRLPRPQK